MSEGQNEFSLRMTPGQFVSLLDSAMRNRRPLAYLLRTMFRFKMLERVDDAMAIKHMAPLFADGEIEMLLLLRAE